METTTHGGARPKAGRPQKSLFIKALERVQNSKQLSPHESFIMADWPEGDEHWRWVITATIKEILDWIEAGTR